MNRSVAMIGAGLTCVAVCLTGCNKRQESETAPPPSTAPQSAPRHSAPALGAQPTPGVAPAAQLTQAETAIKARDYDRAMDAMAALQAQYRQQALNAQQEQAYWSQMRTLQSQLASAVASGDPRAQAAAKRLMAMEGK